MRVFEKTATRALAQRLLVEHGIDSTRLVARHGWSNAAWIGPTHVVRLSYGRLRGSFAHEARVLLRPPKGVPVAPVVAAGVIDDGAGLPPNSEWIITERVPGDTLAERWPALDGTERHRLGVQLGSIIRAIGAMPAIEPPRWWVDAHTDEPWNAYRPDVTLGPVLLDRIAALPDADPTVVDRARRWYEDRIDAFDAATEAVVHGDLHGHNLIVGGDGDEIAFTAVVDWEGAHCGPPDLELDMLLRWVAAADEMGERPDAQPKIAHGDCDALVADVAEQLPELFSMPTLQARLEVHDLHWHLVQILADRWWRDHLDADGGRSNAWPRLEHLLDGRAPHLRLLRSVPWRQPLHGAAERDPAAVTESSSADVAHPRER